MRSGGQVAMVKEEDLVFDVVVNVMKGRDGYGIYFSSVGGVIKTTKLDKGSEAEIAGVQPGDELIFVQDNDKKYPAEDPGSIVPVSFWVIGAAQAAAAVQDAEGNQLGCVCVAGAQFVCFALFCVLCGL